MEGRTHESRFHTACYVFFFFLSYYILEFEIIITKYVGIVIQMRVRDLEILLFEYFINYFLFSLSFSLSTFVVVQPTMFCFLDDSEFMIVSDS